MPVSNPGKRILFVGSPNSDIHLLATQGLPPQNYCRVDVGNVEGLVSALHAFERAAITERNSDAPQLAFPELALNAQSRTLTRLHPDPIK